jgi:hypothetical protein
MKRSQLIEIQHQPLPDPGNAWNVLAVVSESVGHAETKGALIMGAAGAVGGLLYNLYENGTHRGAIVDIALAICGLAVVAAATSAALCLTPRLRSKDAPNSVIYFHHIVRRHRTGMGSADYGALLKAIVADRDRLIDDLATQIWANSHVARQ